MSHSGGRVCVARHDERVAHAGLRQAQELGHGPDLVDDGDLVGGSAKLSEVTDKERERER